MKLLTLCREPRLYSCQRLQQSAQKLGYEMDIYDPNRFLLKLTPKKHSPFECWYQPDSASPILLNLTDYVGVLPRFGISSTQMGCDVLYHLSLANLPVLNHSRAFALARNKLACLQTLAYHQIPVIETLFAGELFAIKECVSHFSSPFIIKTLQGAQGIGVMLTDNNSQAVSILETLRQANISTLSQQFIAESQGEDIRALVIGDTVVAAMQRFNPHGDFRANIHRGGQARMVTLTRNEQEIAINATKCIGLDVAGVDLIHTQQGLKVLEVNASPGFEMIEKVTGIDIASQIINHLLRQSSNSSGLR